ncbi:hypothetical protein [Aeromicrobium marinum]|uniref:hypothetical protein n=1 Tax=Aeromicrobium marinum TaxID=219314 RepID=UPI0001BCCC54|nr:hypothetical protein [Aeromicrobium marinum]
MTMITRIAASAAVLGLLLTAGCGGGDDESAPLPSLGAQTPDEDGGSEDLPTTIEQAKQIAVADLGSSVAETAEEQAAVEAWMTYWEAVTETFSSGSPSPKLDVATGQASTFVLDGLNQLQSTGQRVVGWTRTHVQAIEGSGAATVLRICGENYSFNVDAAGEPTEEIRPFYEITASLSSDGPRTQVTGFAVTYPDGSCLA